MASVKRGEKAIDVLAAKRTLLYGLLNTIQAKEGVSPRLLVERKRVDRITCAIQRLCARIEHANMGPCN